MIDTIAGNLSSELNITCLGEPATFLGIHIECNQKEGIINISQINYFQQITRKFNLKNSYYDVPMPSGLHPKKLAQIEEKTVMACHAKY